MSGKLDRAIAEAEMESRNEGLSTEKYVRERRALDEQIHGVWGKFKSAIRVKCEAKPKHLRFSVCPDTEARVERLGRSHAVLEVRLLQESGVIEFNCGGASGYCTVRLNGNNVAVICDQDGHPYPRLEDVAEEILSLLFLPEKSAHQDV
jgi:hypothetical protein